MSKKMITVDGNFAAAHIAYHPLRRYIEPQPAAAVGTLYHGISPFGNK